MTLSWKENWEKPQLRGSRTQPLVLSQKWKV